jgi:prepilin peptidase CpaA
MIGLAQLLFAACLLCAAALDLRSRRIPDAFSLGIVLAFAAIVVAGNVGLGAAAWHVLAAALVFAAGAGLFAAGMIGGGDVKLMAASSLWIGWSDTLRFLLLVALLGGALAAAALLARRVPRDGRAARLRRLIDADEGLPYGVAIAGAALLIGLPWATGA